MSENTPKYGMIKFEDARIVKIEKCECANVCNWIKSMKIADYQQTG